MSHFHFLGCRESSPIRGISRNPNRGVLTCMLSMNGCGLASWAEFAKVGLRPTIQGLLYHINFSASELHLFFDRAQV